MVQAKGLAHHLGHRRRAGHHGVGDAGQLRDEGRHPHTGIHQALVAVDDTTVFHQHDGHFRGAVAEVRRHARGLEVDDGNASHAARAL